MVRPWSLPSRSCQRRHSLVSTLAAIISRTDSYLSGCEKGQMPESYSSKLLNSFLGLHHRAENCAVNTILSLPFSFPCVVESFAKLNVCSCHVLCVLFWYFFWRNNLAFRPVGFCRAGRGEEKQVGKTDTRVIDESFISQNKLLELHSKWLVLRQKGTGWQAGWEEPARQLRSALLALSDLS